MPALPLQTLASLASQCGLEVYGAMDSEVALEALASAAPHLAAWQADGHAADMEYMKRPVSLFTGLEHFLPGCRSVVSFVVNYSQRAPGHSSGRIPPAPHGFARVARYAWGNDYHQVLRSRLLALVRLVEATLQVPPGGIRARVFSDAVPILERVLALRSRLGFIGKNTMLIRPGLGSFSFTCEILWDVDIVSENDKPAERSAAPLEAPGSGCKVCRRCLDACPTAAFPRAGVLDAARCISYLTIEKRGPFSDWERKAVGDWIFGCDICQEVCPFNHDGAPSTSIQEFVAVPDRAPYILLRDVLSLRSKAEFRKRFGASALMRAGWEQLQRNACAVVGNTGCIELKPQLNWLYENSESEMVRDASLKALAEFSAMGLERRS